MRIVAGRHRGRAILAPEGADVRPTSDRAREAVFNILAHRPLGADGPAVLAGARVLDAFAGTGALGLEALSRGAAHCVFLENNRSAIAALRRNVDALDEADHVTILQVDATKPPRAGEACDLAFLDPPYGKGLVAPTLVVLDAGGWFTPDAIVVVEHAAADAVEIPAGFEAIETRRYGKAVIELLRRL